MKFPLEVCDEKKCQQTLMRWTGGGSVQIDLKNEFGFSDKQIVGLQNSFDFDQVEVPTQSTVFKISEEL